MWRAFTRKGIADLRSRPLQSVLVFLVVATSAGTLLLAVTLGQAASEPFERAHQEANGAHVWIESTQSGAARLAELPQVVEASPVLPQVRGALIRPGNPVGLKLWAIAGDQPNVSPATIVDGRWAAPASESEVVLNREIARQNEIEVGDTIEVVSAVGATSLEVVGIAIDLSQSLGAEPAPTFVSEWVVEVLVGGPLASFSQNELNVRQVGYRVGVRIEDPEAADEFERTLQTLGSPITHSWLGVREDARGAVETQKILLRVFSLFALAASAFIIINVITTQVLTRRREVGVLKAVGFTPRQVTGLLLIEQLTLGVAAAIAGVIVATFVQPLLLANAADKLRTTAPTQFDLPTMALVVGLVAALIAAFTLLPAWRAGRISAVDAIAPGRGSVARRGSRLARVAGRLRLPRVVVYGLKDAFARKSRAWLNIAAIGVAAAAAMMALTFTATLNHIFDNSVEFGEEPFELRVQRLPEFGSVQAARGIRGGGAGTEDPLDLDGVLALVDGRDGVEAVATSRRLFATLPGISDRFEPTVALGGAAAMELWAPAISEGRPFRGGNEAVVDLALGRERGIEIGDEITLLIENPAGGANAFRDRLALTLTVVGRINDQSSSVFYPLEALQAVAPTVNPGDVLVQLGEAVDARAVADAIVADSGGRVTVTDRSSVFEDGNDEERALVPVVLGLSAVLIAVASVNLLSSLLLSVRERTREVGIMKTLGFTPRQVVASILSGVLVLTVIGTLLGSIAGYVFTRWLLETVTAEEGLPSGFVQFPPLAWLALLVPMALLIAVLGAGIPARRAARLRVADALRYE